MFAQLAIMFLPLSTVTISILSFHNHIFQALPPPTRIKGDSYFEKRYKRQQEASAHVQIK